MKKIIVLLLLVLLSFSTWGYEGEISVLINGKYATSLNQSSYVDGVLMISTTPITRHLDIYPKWETVIDKAAGVKRVLSHTLVYEGKEYVTTFGEKFLRIDGKLFPLPVAPTYNGSDNVPLRAYAEAFGLVVNWVPEKNVVMIRDKEFIDEVAEELETPHEFPSSVVFKKFDDVQFGFYTLDIENFEELFGFDGTYAFRTTCINRPDLNFRHTYRGDGSPWVVHADSWRMPNGASGEPYGDLFTLRYRDSKKYDFMPHPAIPKDEVAPGELLQFEVEVRYNRTGEIKVYQAEYVW